MKKIKFTRKYNGFAQARTLVDNALDLHKCEKHEGGRMVYAQTNSDINNVIINISSNTTRVSEVCSALLTAASEGLYAPSNRTYEALKFYSTDELVDECLAIFPAYIAFNVERLAEGITPVSLAEFCQLYFTNGIDDWFLASPYCMFCSITEWIAHLNNVSRELTFNRQLIIEFEMTYNLLHTYSRSIELRKTMPDLLYLLNRKYKLLIDKFVDISDNILAACEYMPTTF